MSLERNLKKDEIEEPLSPHIEEKTLEKEKGSNLKEERGKKIIQTLEQLALNAENRKKIEERLGFLIEQQENKVG